ncbi:MULTISPECIES: DUF2628 domain-containing protein [unclassified Cobetia]|uniref:DUF2628 domain-containing protein n=1 Tax=unclassified Cobetia TaxID=2609414 RepID=UPI002097CE0B|nr:MULTISPECIES: DUF2628 domain-containing protein [unclassified Cobetia]MCO7233504.1 DUF2628 domain-containing protein [Cobetia sp. Dlab-2-AX]MCO7236780.1 DUF2628 domain-containing protein [Cobetia sp. Dlab-2-U]
MASFRILTHPQHGTLAVKIGWSWPAFFFGMFWALYKRMWLLAGSLFGFIVLSSVFIPATMEGQLISNVLFLGLNLTISLKGNQWYASLLETQGYREQAQVSARNPDDALAVHANSHKASADDIRHHEQGGAHSQDQDPWGDQRERKDGRGDRDERDDDDNGDGGSGGKGGGNTSGTFIG